jgi:hypothetical protein
MIQFISENIKYFTLVLGNHESFVAKYLTGEISEKSVKGMKALIRDCFTSISVLKDPKNNLYKNLFLSMYESSMAFADITVGENRVMVTHAPCRHFHLGSVNTTGLREQRNLQRHRISEDYYTDFVEDALKDGVPTHLFGHVPVMNPEIYGNKVALDGGCAAGNRLAGAIISSNSIQIVSVKSQQPVKVPSNEEEELYLFNEIFPKKETL